MTRKHDPKTDRLAELTLFSRCPPEELRKIAALTTEISAEPGKILCKEGSTGSEAFVVEEGEAEVTIEGKHIATIGPGGFFGEMALLDGGPRVGTVTAVSPMRLLALNRGEFRDAIQSSPATAWALLEGIGRRLREIESHGPLT